MNRIICTFATSLLVISPKMATAQEEPPQEQAQQQAAIASLQSTGRAANWENWVYAGGVLAAAAIGMTFIILNQGAETH